MVVAMAVVVAMAAVVAVVVVAVVVEVGTAWRLCGKRWAQSNTASSTLMRCRCTVAMCTTQARRSHRVAMAAPQAAQGAAWWAVL